MAVRSTENPGTRGKMSSKKISYKKLWKLLIDREMTKTQLREAAGVSASSMAKLSRGGNVTTETLLRICLALNCSIEEIMEIQIEETGE